MVQNMILINRKYPHTEITDLINIIFRQRVKFNSPEQLQDQFSVSKDIFLENNLGSYLAQLTQLRGGIFANSTTKLLSCYFPCRRMLLAAGNRFETRSSGAALNRRKAHFHSVYSHRCANMTVEHARFRGCVCVNKENPENLEKP